MLGDPSAVSLVSDLQVGIVNLPHPPLFGVATDPVWKMGNQVVNIPRGGNQALFEDVFESHPMVDYSDNAAQSDVIRHHYLSEFGNHISLNEVLKDYSKKAVIHEVFDNVPHTYKGREGARQAFRDMYSLLPHDLSNFELEHLAVNHNHAQVVWRAETPSHAVIRGTDSFAFDNENRIETQTTVALTTEPSS